MDNAALVILLVGYVLAQPAVLLFCIWQERNQYVKSEAP